MEMLKTECSNIYDSLIIGIVLYRTQIAQSKSFSSLKSSAFKGREEMPQIIFYDNSEKETGFGKTNQLEALKLGCHYYNNPCNPGLSVAYNYFLNYGKEKGCKWLVLLDQDTTLPENFLQIYRSNYFLKGEIPVIRIPVVKTQHIVLSPSKLRFGRNFLLKSPQQGKVPFGNLVFVNSGLMISIDFAIGINGFNEKLKLDFVDTEFCLRAKNATDEIEILPIVLNQSFSHFEDNFQGAKKRFKIFDRDLNVFKSIRPNERIYMNLNYFLHTLKLSIKYKSLYFILFGRGSN